MNHEVREVSKARRVLSLVGGGSLLAGIIFLYLALEFGSEHRIKAMTAVIFSLLFVLGGLLVVSSSRLRNPDFRFFGSKPKPRVIITFSVLLSIFVANYFAVGMRHDAYPFYSVRMFNWLGPEREFPQTYFIEKYGHQDDGQVRILDLRREGSLLFQEFLPWTFGHSASFSSTFHNRGKAQNLDFLERETGLSLFVVVQKVDLSTGQVTLVDGLCAYRELSDTIAYYYGPLAVPSWQSKECE